LDGKGKGHLRWQLQGHFEGKDPLMARAKALRRQKPLEGKGHMKIKAKAFRRQRPSEGKVRIVRLKQANILFTHNQSSVSTAGSEDVVAVKPVE
jgi:hypothetical protein